MAQISNTNLQHIVDKAARHAAEADGVGLASAIATSAAYTVTAPTGGLTVADTDVLALLLTLVQGFTDQDQMADFIPPVNDLNEVTPVLQAYMFSFWAKVRKALDNHMARYIGNAMAVGDLSPLDAALRVINATTLTLRVSGLFNKYFGGIASTNQFTPIPFVLATVAATGASAATFVHVSSISGIYGPGQIALMNTKGETSEATITFTATKGGVGIVTSIAAGALTNQYLTAATDTSQTYTDAPAFTSISGATAGDTYAIVILPDRTINAA